MTDLITGEMVVAEARGWLGVTWMHQGRTRLGVDCAGLVIMVARQLGLSDQDFKGYPRRPDGSFLRTFLDNLDRVTPNNRTSGDVLVFAEGRHPCHCGVLHVPDVGPASVIHAHALRRKVVEETLADALSTIGRPVHCFRYRGVANG